MPFSPSIDQRGFFERAMVPRLAPMLRRESRVAWEAAPRREVMASIELCLDRREIQLTRHSDLLMLCSRDEAPDRTEDVCRIALVLESRPANAGEWVVVGERANPQSVVIKRYYRDGGLVRLVSAVPTREPILVPAGDVQVQGVVVGLMRKL